MIRHDLRPQSGFIVFAGQASFWSVRSCTMDEQEEPRCCDVGHRVGTTREDGRPCACDRRTQQAYDLALMDDLRFLQAWEKGQVPVVGATVRIRQIRRATLQHAAAGPSVHGAD